MLFAAIVGFMGLSIKLEPGEMVDLLNTVFSYLDSFGVQYDVEKIRTIGDNDMVASGAPTPCPYHAHRLARMAFDRLA